MVTKTPEEQEAMKEWFADYLEKNPGPSAEDYEPFSNPMQVLKAEDWKELSSKYNPTNMTQAEYDAFLNDLCEMSVLHTSDLQDLGHSAYTGLTKITAASLRPQLLNNDDLPPVGFVPTFQDGASHVNILYWTQGEKSWQYYDEVPQHASQRKKFLYPAPIICL